MLAALLLPILVLLFGSRFRWAGWRRRPRACWLARPSAHTRDAVPVFLLSLFHWAHRFRYTLYDGLQIKHLNGMINTLCYGGHLGRSRQRIWFGGFHRSCISVNSQLPTLQLPRGAVRRTR